MNSTHLAQVHLYSALLFLVIYLVKTVLLFAGSGGFDRFSKMIRVPEMIISFLFLATGIWLYFLLGAIKTAHIIKLVLVVAAIPLAVLGFKKKNKALALFSFLLIVSVYGLAEMARNKPFIADKVVLNQNDLLESGAALYKTNCAMCHGDDGTKRYRKAADLSASMKDEASVEAMVSSGVKRKMPGYSKALSQEERAAIARFVITLQKKRQEGNTIAQ